MNYRNRIHYRNTTFLHIGHLQTIYYNNDIAQNHNGQCYVIIDDRSRAESFTEMKEHFNYLGVTHMQLISVSQYYDRILEYTKELVRDGHICIQYLLYTENHTDRILRNLEHPTNCFQIHLKTNDMPISIGYSREIIGLDNSSYGIVLVFDYIIKVLDYLLGITNIVTTAQTDITDPAISSFFNNVITVEQDILPTYHIDGFRYSKRDWPNLDEKDPRLLTLPGLRARHVPATVLYAFYLHSMQTREVKINFLETLLRRYLNITCSRICGVVNPIKVYLENWSEFTTEFVCKPKLPFKNDKDIQYLVPLSNELYIDRDDFGFENDTNLSKTNDIKLKYGPTITCTDVDIEPGVKEIQAVYNYALSSKTKKCIHWVSSEWGEEPIKVRYYMYNWFYTGINSLLPVTIRDGFMENEPFRNLQEIYQLERVGYFIYDETLSQKNRIPCFVRICSIKNYYADNYEFSSRH